MNAKRKHIAFFGTKYFPSKGGTSRVVESIIWRLKDTYEITIYCYKHPKAATNIPGVKTVQFSAPNIKGLGVFIYFIKCLNHLLLKGQYDLVHVQKTEAAFFLPFITLKYQAIATSHEIPYLNNKWSRIGRAFFHTAEWIFMHSRATPTSISKVQAKYYQDKYDKPVVYIPNGIEQPKVIGASQLEDYLQKNGISEPYLFFAARRIIPLKGCHHMLKALSEMKYDGLIVIAGDLDQMPQYSASLKKYSDQLRIKFLGYIDSVELLNGLAQKATFFIFPSEIEGMSMMLLEVAGMDTPLVCSDIPPNQAIFNHDQVLYFRSEDSKDLIRALNWAFSNREEMTQKAHAAKAHAVQHYGIDMVGKKYIALYEEHLKKDN